MFLLNRIPKWQEITPVYAVISFVLYSWSILWFFWQLPGWFYFMTVPEIINVAVYTFMTNFMESITLMFGIVLVSILLPTKFFSSAFVARGVSLAILSLGYMMYFAFQFGDREDYPTQLVRLIPVVLLLIMVIAFVVGRTNWLKKTIENFADRATVFLYILLPLSFISIAVVIFRNVF